MKLSAIAGRRARRDFWDLHALLVAIPLRLEEAVQLFREKDPIEDVGHVIRSLVYYADADAEPPLVGLSPEAWTHIKSDLTSRVRAI